MMTMTMTSVLAAFLVALFAAGSIANPLPMVRQKSGVTALKIFGPNQEHRAKDFERLIFDKLSNRRMTDHERSFDGKKMDASRVDKQTDTAFARIKPDMETMKNKQEAAIAKMVNQNIKLWNRHSNDVSESLTHAQNLPDNLGHVMEVSQSPGCQAGTVGDTWYKGIEFTYPRYYHVVFEPAFATPPKFMYGLIHLDAASYVRVNVKVVALGTTYATIEIGTWEKKKLYGAKVRWMACP